MEADELPYISVIITAYKRKDFLLNAIKSVVNQTLNKKYYEIIVIKNFRDENIDDFINKNEIVGIISNDNSLQGKLIEALNVAKGTIISFLEDDDLFFENKLEIVYNKFNRNNKLIYYHNSMIPITGENKILTNWYKQENGIIIGDSASKLRILRRFIEYGGHNLSSISISRNIILKNSKIFGSSTYSLDYAILLLCLTMEGLILSDSERLTLYREHTSSSHIYSKNRNEFTKNRCFVNEQSVATFNNFRSVISSANANIKGVYSFMLSFLLIKQHFFCGSITDVDIRKFAKLFKYRLNTKDYLMGLFLILLIRDKSGKLKNVALNLYLKKVMNDE